jgi:hypothetical protein
MILPKPTLQEAFARWREAQTEEAKQAALEALAEAVERRDRSRATEGRGESA